MSGTTDLDRPHREEDLSHPSSALVDRLRHSFLSVSEALEAGDFRRSDDSIAGLIDILNSILEAEESPHEEALLEIRHFLSPAASNPMAADTVALAVPAAVVRFSCVSDKCRSVAESIIDCIVSMCSPRDLLSILCEALDFLGKVSKDPIQIVLLLRGLSKVFTLIKRNHIQQMKVAVPVVLNALVTTLLESDEKLLSSVNELNDAIIAVAMSIQEISSKLVGEAKQEMNSILGLYVLQIMALISKSNLANEVSNFISFIKFLSRFLPLSGLSYVGLITGSDIDLSRDVFSEDDMAACFSFVEDGACLAVIWGHISEEIAEAAGEQLTATLKNLRNDQTKKWQAVSMLRYVLSPADYPWAIKAHSIDLLLNIMGEEVKNGIINSQPEDSSMMLSLYALLKGIEKFIIYASDASLRKKGFSALKRVLSDLSSSQQFEMLKALITDNTSPSMIAILIDLVKERILIEKHHVMSPTDELTHIWTEESLEQDLWSSEAVELVELVLKPPKGGPPSFPEDCEPVISALNLYRFILLRGTAGKPGCGSALSDENLQRAYSEWLLPLRTLVSGIEAENRNDDSDFAFNIICALNPIQIVLYRCIELVEEKLKYMK